MFGYSNLDELPELPRYRVDENQQIVIDDLIEAKEEKSENEINEDTTNENIDKKEETNEPEAPLPEENN